MTRRALLRRCLLVVGVHPWEALERLPGRARRLASWFGVDARDAPTAETLSEPALDDLVAFAEILVEGRTLEPAERRYLVEYIEDRAARSAWHRELYGTTVGLLERLAGQRFSSLTGAERVELIARHRLGVSEVLPGEDLGRFFEDVRFVRRRAVPDLLGAYYASPAGWAVVGYQTFPGRCGDLTRYTRMES